MATARPRRRSRRSPEPDNAEARSTGAISCPDHFAEPPIRRRSVVPAYRECAFPMARAAHRRYATNGKRPALGHLILEADVTHRFGLICSAAFLLAFGTGPLHAQQSGAQSGDEAKPAVVIANISTLNATVTAVDKADRVVTLRGDDGREQTIKCGPEVRNFDQIEVGDRVAAQYH